MKNIVKKIHKYKAAMDKASTSQDEETSNQSAFKTKTKRFSEKPEIFPTSSLQNQKKEPSPENVDEEITDNHISDVYSSDSVVGLSSMASLEELSPYMDKHKLSDSKTFLEEDVRSINRNSFGSKAFNTNELLAAFLGIPTIKENLPHKNKRLSTNPKKLIATAVKEPIEKKLFLFQSDVEYFYLACNSARVGMGGCVIDFEADTFGTDVNVGLSYSYPVQISIDEGIVITPEINCTIDKDEKPKKSYSISINTCYVKLSKHKTILVQVQYYENETQVWNTMCESDNSLTATAEVKFTTKKFGRFRCLVQNTECTKLAKNIYSAVYLTDRNTLVWCILDNLHFLQAKLWFEMFPPSLYKPILPWEIKCIEYGCSLYLNINPKHGAFVAKDKSNLEMTEIWHAVLYKKIFFFPKSVNNDGDTTLSFIEENQSMPRKYTDSCTKKMISVISQKDYSGNEDQEDENSSQLNSLIRCSISKTHKFKYKSFRFKKFKKKITSQPEYKTL